MNSLHRFIFSRLGLILAMAVVATGCSTSPKPTVAAAPAPNILRVGVTPNSAPFISKNGGTYVGAEADLAQALAARLGKQVKFVELPFDQLLPALDADKIDIVMSGMTATEMREPLAQFCTPYMYTGESLLVRSDDAARFADVSTFFQQKMRVGVERGTIAEMVADRCQYAKVSIVTSPTDAVNRLRARTIDVFLADSPVVRRLGAQYAAEGLTAINGMISHEKIAWAVRRGNAELLAAANGVIAQWQADGTLYRIVSSHIPLDS